jgi:deferrochelatase/peroxidase EfeB
VRRELAADIDEIDPDANPAIPSADTGELGVQTGYDTTGLAITLGVSSSGFSRLGVSGANLPQDLIPINWGAFSDSPANSAEGDIVLQIGADSSYIVEHVLRRIEHTLTASFTITWAIAGEQRNGGDHGGPLTADSARSLNGFHDGLSNLDPSDPNDQLLIFAGQNGAPALPTPPGPGPQPAPQPGQPGYNQSGQPEPSFPTLRQPPTTPEPAWAKDGTYMVIRASVINVCSWDQLPLSQQQEEIVRFKYSGATLDNPNEPAHRHDPPAFATTPGNTAVPLNSHIRRANPRAQTSDALRRFFRRGYPLMVGSTTGSLQRGLLFVAFARSISTQVEFVLQAWLKNPDFPQPGNGIDPILQLDSVLCGGYYFVPPVTDPNQPWSYAIPGV